MSKTIPPPIDVGAILAAMPTTENLFSMSESDEFRNFVRHRIDALGLMDDLAWVFDEDTLNEYIEHMMLAYTTSYGVELANEFVENLIENAKEMFSINDRRLIQLIYEIAIHPHARFIVRQSVRESLVTSLRQPIVPLANQLVALVDSIAVRAGVREWEVHLAFCGLSASWYQEMVHHNTLVAVFDCVQTESKPIVIAGRLLKMSVLYETRLKPFILTLDQSMATAGFFKPVEKQTVGSALKRICDKLAAEMPEYTHLLNPSWVDLRNAALHGNVRRTPGSLTGLVTGGKVERVWDEESTAMELERIENLVSHLGAIPQAIGILASRFSLRFQTQIEEDMLIKYEALIEWVWTWLSNNPAYKGEEK